jgi:hypothetical protein
MFRRVRLTAAALASGSTVAVGLILGATCSVDRAGLSNGDVARSTGGLGGLSSSAGGPGGSPGAAGAGLGSSGSSGSSGGIGGQLIGSTGTGGATGQSGQGGGDRGAFGGSGNSGGATGAAGGGPGGTTSAGGNGVGGLTGGGGGAGTELGGYSGVGGATGGGSGAAGGTNGTGGMGVAAGSGGAAGATIGPGGAGGATGAGGVGGSHSPSCSQFPAGASYVTPTDNLLHCYWVHSNSTDWTSSENSCVMEGGTLATVLSSQENMFVFGLLMRAGLFGGNGVSLGAWDSKASDDRSGSGSYAWVTGEAWSFTNWHSGRPDGACTCSVGGSCACDHWLTMIYDGTWEDGSENTARPYVCEAIAR